MSFNIQKGMNTEMVIKTKIAFNRKATHNLTKLVIMYIW